MRHVTPNALTLIQKYEGFSPIVYTCPSGFLTIGYGHALRKGESFSNNITKEEATDLLQRDILSSEISVLRQTKVCLSDGQFDALVDFTFNLGGGAYQRSTLRSKINRGEYYDASQEFEKWCWGGGRKLPGLLRRRISERDLFLYGALI